SGSSRWRQTPSRQLPSLRRIAKGPAPAACVRHRPRMQRWRRGRGSGRSAESSASCPACFDEIAAAQIGSDEEVLHAEESAQCKLARQGGKQGIEFQMRTAIGSAAIVVALSITVHARIAVNSLCVDSGAQAFAKVGQRETVAFADFGSEARFAQKLQQRLALVTTEMPGPFITSGPHAHMGGH